MSRVMIKFQEIKKHFPHLSSLIEGVLEASKKEIDNRVLHELASKRLSIYTYIYQMEASYLRKRGDIISESGYKASVTWQKENRSLEKMLKGVKVWVQKEVSKALSEYLLKEGVGLEDYFKSSSSIESESRALIRAQSFSSKTLEEAKRYYMEQKQKAFSVSRVASMKLSSSKKNFLLSHGAIIKNKSRQSPNAHDKKVLLKPKRGSDLKWEDFSQLNSSLCLFFSEIKKEGGVFLEEKWSFQWESWFDVTKRVSRCSFDVRGKVYMYNNDVYSYRYNIEAEGLELRDFQKLLSIGLKCKKYEDTL